MPKPTPKEAAAIKWFNKLPTQTRLKIIEQYGSGLEATTQAYEEWSTQLKSSHEAIDTLLRGKV